MLCLDEILAYKKYEVEDAKRTTSPERLASTIASLPSVRPFVGSLRSASFPAIISEIKKKSPSKGEIRPDLDHRQAALGYSQGGAACFSILTDSRYFGGSLAYISEIREVVPHIPILRKDFVIDEYQILESRASGADCVLLIAGVLEKEILRHFVNVSLTVGLDVLIEAHSRTEIDDAVCAYTSVASLADRSKITVGINNRDLKTFNTSVQTGVSTLKWLPEQYSGDLLEGIPLVAESGIFTGTDVADLYFAGATAFLVGESLIREGNPGANLQKLIAEARSAVEEGTVRTVAL